MKRTITYIITNEFENNTIQSFLAAHGYPHQVLVLLKQTTNGILLNGTWAYVRQKLQAGDTLTIHLEEPTVSPQILPVKQNMDIIFEDEDILVVNKPANMPIHPSMGNHDNTLANIVMDYYTSQGFSFTYRCMNRLDRDTSGLTIIAKHCLSAGILSREIANRQVHRTYLAVCENKVNDYGTIDAPIGRIHDSAIERGIDFEHGERAVTHYKRIAYREDYNLSLVQLQLETGRTHQIRVHMKYIGNPLIGDFLYNPDYTYMNRQGLHSYSLDFTHPVTAKKMHLNAQLPLDIKCLFPDVEFLL